MKFNADEKVYEPIEVVLNGKTYKVETVSQDFFDKIKEASKENDNGVIFRQLGAVFGVDPEEFKGVDLRKAAAVMKFLTETITSQLEGKNV